MIPTPSYVEVISRYYPSVQVTCSGDGTIFEDITLEAGEQIPTKETLDGLKISLLKEQVWREIQKVRDFRKGAGVKVGNFWFHSDDTSRIQNLALVMFGQNMPAGIMWKTMSGTFVEMTPQLAMGIFAAIATSDTMIFAKAEQLRAAVNASNDPGNFDYETGWPLIYGE